MPNKPETPCPFNAGDRVRLRPAELDHWSQYPSVRQRWARRVGTIAAMGKLGARTGRLYVVWDGCRAARICYYGTIEHVPHPAVNDQEDRCTDRKSVV